MLTMFSDGVGLSSGCRSCSLLGVSALICDCRNDQGQFLQAAYDLSKFGTLSLGVLPVVSDCR